MEIKSKIEIDLTNLYKNWCGLDFTKIDKLPHSGSNRTYYRIASNNINAIGVYNKDQKENEAFISFTNQLQASRINVPKIYSIDINNNIYLIEDLGDNQLLNWLLQNRKSNEFPINAIEIYKMVIQELVKIQIIAGRNFDYSKCHQYSEFNMESILFDLDYFKNNYVDAIGLKYNSKDLIKDFETFANYLLKAENGYFMFRDFQARNILLQNNEAFFIDYQGGRKGPLQYDLVSLLFQAKAQIPEEIKTELLNYYISLAKMYAPIESKEFTELYFGFALIRVLQTLGAYGLRGLIEGKNHFIESIPLAIKNLIYLKDKAKVLNNLNELECIIDKIVKRTIK